MYTSRGPPRGPACAHWIQESSVHVSKATKVQKRPPFLCKWQGALHTIFNTIDGDTFPVQPFSKATLYSTAIRHGDILLDPGIIRRHFSAQVYMLCDIFCSEEDVTKRILPHVAGETAENHGNHETSIMQPTVQLYR